MLIYGISLFIIIILWAQVNSISDYKVKRLWVRRCCFGVSLLFITIAALRGASVGTDTASYIHDYSVVKLYTFEQIIESYSDNPGYYLVSKVFSEWGVSVQVWFAIVEALYIYSVSRLIYRFSKDPGLSYILFVTIGFYAFSLAGLKQTVAMSFIFIGYRYLYDSKYVRYVLFVVLASLFHLSSLVFLFAVVIHFIKKSRFYYALLSILFVIWMFSYNTVANNLLTVLNFEHYTSYLEMEKESGGTLTMFFIILLIQLVSMIYMKMYSKENKMEARDIFGMSYLGMLTQLLSLVAASAFRVGLYYSLFSIILLPNCIDIERNAKTRMLLKTGIIFTFCFYFWYSNHNGSSIVPYVFYWND